MANQTWIQFRYKWSICCLSNPATTTDMESWSLDLARLEKQLRINLWPLELLESVWVPQQNAAGKDPGPWLRCPCAFQQCHCNTGVFHVNHSPGEEALEPEAEHSQRIHQGRKRALCWWEHFPWLCLKYPQHSLPSHCSPLESRAARMREKKETKMSTQVGAFCRETLQWLTQKKRESSPFFLYVRISLKLPLFVWRIKYSIKNPFRGKGGWYQGFRHNITSIMGYTSLTKYIYIFICNLYRCGTVLFVNTSPI